MRSYEVCFDEVFGSALSAALWFGRCVCGLELLRLWCLLCAAVDASQYDRGHGGLWFERCGHRVGPLKRRGSQRPDRLLGRSEVSWVSGWPTSIITQSFLRSMSKLICTELPGIFSFVCVVCSGFN